MADLRLRDRDSIVTKEGLVFRVFGYSHPSESFICDAEYASSKIFVSNNPKAPRTAGRDLFYKFYEDEGWQFIQKRYPQYLIHHDMLDRKVMGVNRNDLLEVRKPDKSLSELNTKTSNDDLVAAMHDVLRIAEESTNLRLEDFGVFGSLMHGFYHPRLSDIDLVVYGKKNLVKLRDALQQQYASDSTLLKNEFETDKTVRGKNWQFRSFSLKDYAWHQRRKLIYALFDDQRTGRTIKTEFEPVKNWNEIKNEYDPKTRIISKGWTRILATIVEDDDSPFIPSVYTVEPQEVLEGPREAIEAKRIVSFMEEFRLQTTRGETVEVRGNLEEVLSPRESFHQVALTYCPRYYEQALKVIS